MKRWTPPIATTRKEQLLLKRLTRTKKLFAFLRLHRHELFTDSFQEELEGMYRKTGAGSEPLPPAVLWMQHDCGFKPFGALDHIAEVWQILRCLARAAFGGIST